jgi:phosphate transport system substrate-binding protein
MKMTGKVMILASALMMALSGVSQAQMLQIKGSDTMVNLVQRLAEEYMKKNPSKKLAVTGGGSGTGIAAVINKKCDIANASRGMKESEVAQAMKNGVNPTRVVIAIDAISVIVHGSNKIDRLTVDQIGKIFRGEITNWSELGGANMPIKLYGRQSNSGTFGFFMDNVLKGDYSPKMNRMNGNAQIVEAVKTDPSAVGYVGAGYVKKSQTGLKVIKVARNAASSYGDPLIESDVKGGAYPIARPLNQYVAGVPAGAVKEFLAFEVSAQGQKVVEDAGFYSLSKDYQDYNIKAGL